MKPLHYLTTCAIVLAMFAFVSCSKGVDQKKKADDFKAAITDHGYRPVAFYSDKPIDYLPNDSVKKSETDLWKYVKDYIKDDRYVFGSDGIAVVYQNELKVNWSNKDTLHFKYSIESQDDKVYINFINYDYYPQTYKLESFDSTQMILYIDGPSGSKLFSKYVRLN